MPPWWSEKSAKRRQNARSSRQERKIAREVGGKVQAGSGSSRRAPGDVKSSDELIQVKYTDANSYRLTVGESRKVHDDALKHGREPAMIVDFVQHGVRLRIHIERI
jgi:hypothetical protein